MDWLNDNFTIIYITLIAVLLYSSYYFLQRSKYDERRRNRFRRTIITQRISYFKEKLFNEEHELFLRRNGVPSYITSVHINAIRYGVLILLIVITLVGLLIGKQLITMANLFLWGVIPVILTPKKPFPLHYMVQSINRRHENEISNEVYQFYNEIKSHFQTRSNGLANTYLIVQQSLPYYKKIRITLEKMLPLLEKKKMHDAWDLFGNGINTHESRMLGLVMKEVEATGTEQALMLLEQKRQEFSNHLYNRYTDYLRKRKNIIFFLVVFGAMMVFVNEITVFFMWYKDVMSVVNQSVN